jgi:hypothetical protein
MPPQVTKIARRCGMKRRKTLLLLALTMALSMAFSGVAMADTAIDADNPKCSDLGPILAPLWPGCAQ